MPSEVPVCDGHAGTLLERRNRSTPDTERRSKPYEREKVLLELRG